MSFLNEKEQESITNNKVKVLKDIKDIWSAILYGNKGTSKSTTVYSINDAVGLFVVLDFDGNAKRVINLVVPKNKVDNFIIYNIKDMLNFAEMKDAFKVPKQAYKVYEKVEEIIYEKISKMNPAPNFIVFDGFQRWVWICEMAMRAVHMKGKNPFTDGGNWNMWKERNFYVDRSFQGAMQFASDAVFLTVHEVQKDRKVLDEDKSTDKKKVYKTESYTEPTWMSTVKEEVDIVIESTNRNLGKVGGGSLYEQTIHSNKVTGREGSVDVTGDPVALWTFLFEKISKPLIK